ncbi:zincin [Corynespora cassiicola Philippines]|uniref:Zincin n=1 Tax=Corynespora cassiicola Philippines TaxID=1448308 RepID=A0A2T2NR24_CORCC|nr:zincin [Corynespora cassiicola Philippines]
MIRHLLLASLGLLATASKPFDCGTDAAHASEDFLASISSLHANQNSGSPASRAALAARDKQITVKTVFHIAAKAEHKDDISNDMPSAQLDTLNEVYKEYGIQFDLVNVTWNTNDVWAVGEKDADQEMKKALRQGTYSTLNIYFQTDLSGGVLGRCTLPSKVSDGGKVDPSVYVHDGCNVNANTMPGGVMDGYNRGKTAVHETGHWLGLLHTFEGYSCDGPGDYIDDTPQESVATDGCPESPAKSSCPNAPGDDPIHNFMDYSIDSCYTGFTSMQHDRMHSMYSMYREGN